jgi:hypothetical protein
MSSPHYRSIRAGMRLDRRQFLQTSGLVGGALALGSPAAWAEGEGRSDKPATNVAEANATPRTAHSLPGPFPGRVVEVADAAAMPEAKADAAVVRAMFQSGLSRLTGEGANKSFAMLFTPEDLVGIKVNPVGAGLISTRLELVDAIVAWLEAGGLPRENIVIWDRFDGMLRDAGFTEDRYPGIGIEGLQTMDESAASGESDDNSRWLDEGGRHVSATNFDTEVSYWADVEGPKDEAYLNQHVFNGKDSYFGKLLTQRLTKIINVPVFKNTGNGISIATKNLGYGAICNTGRLHRPLFFDVCTEVLAFPAIRDKLVLNVADGLRAQYEGGPMPVADHTWIYNRLYLATDPIALDMACHRLLVDKRKAMGIDVNEHPMFTDYLRYAEELGLGVADPERIELLRA